MDERVYETLVLELGSKVVECFDSFLRIKARAGAAESITDIRQQYGSPRVSEAYTPNVRYPDGTDGASEHSSPRRRLPSVQAPRRR